MKSIPTDVAQRRSTVAGRFHAGWPLSAGLACLLTLAGLSGLTPAARAGLPEPGARIYGSIALNGVVVTSADTTVVVEARRTPTGPPIASYHMGSRANAGNFYSIKVDGEDLAPLADPGNVVLGSTLHLVVLDASGVRDQKTFSLTSRGTIARVDFGAVDTDGDGMSDEFELTYFGNSTNGVATADTDLDGRPNLREFLQGTDPNVADGRHPADITPADDRLTLGEVTDYILAWKTGGTWPVEPALTATNIVDYITRAGALWKGGETYVFDNEPATNAPMWWVNVASPALAGPAALVGTEPGGTPRLMGGEPGLRAVRELPADYRPNQTAAVAVDLTPAATTRAYAVVETPPAGWIIRNLSHEGRWDAVNRQIKWGPYFDQSPRRFTYDAVPGPESRGVAAFAGRASFDGYGFASGGTVQLYPQGQAPAPRLAVTLEPGGLRVRLDGTPGTPYELQSSPDLVTWTSGPTVTAGSDGKADTVAATGTTARFFRLKPVE